MQPKLLVISGPREGQTFVLGEVFSIGRQDGNDYQVLEASVSRNHCEIHRRGDGFELLDLDSSHGSFVNSAPVRSRALAHSDLIQVGPAALLFLAASPSRLEASQDDEALDAGSTIQRRPEEIRQLLLDARSRRSPEDLALLFEISTAVQTLREADPLAKRLLELLFRRLPARRAGAFLVSDDGGGPRLVTAMGDGDLKVSRTILTRIFDSGSALLWDDKSRNTGLDAAESLLGLPVRSVLAAPLTGRNHVHGALYFQASGSEAFTEEHLEVTAAAAGIGGLALDTARSLEDLRAENQRLRGHGSEVGFVGQSRPMEELLDFISRVAPVDSTVLLRGESGTGKELAARAIHQGSPRAKGPFIAINCATLSETLLESELFGHEKGAFTGAFARKIGKLEAAHEGTLFLDEVGEIPTALQARLLRALQERSFERLGGNRPIQVDVRMIAATNRDLESAIREGTFREDLFYRINVIAFTLPPLKDRRADIPLLARHFCRLHGERLNRPSVGLDPQAIKTLAAYDWPGNVRQLSNAIERALVLGDGEWIRPEDLPDEMLEGSAEEVPLSDFQTTLTETKKRLLLTALDESQGNAAAAARQLGLHPNSFRRLMRQLGLKESSQT